MRTRASKAGWESSDQAGLAQGAQVPAHGRRRDPQRPGQLARRSRPPAQKVDRAAPVRIGQGREGAVQGGRARTQSRSRTDTPPAAVISSSDMALAVWPKDQMCPSGSAAM